ncbi:MAG: bifunctional phosphoribosylaminoimidazolecarboxamide formyltransferase/IMP cyclohydrolase [Acetobacter sp.]|nr:bifunctional phosphoribosylaminoimidazolecarboxamide formyltransferase/IMP cyclohydrolase [Acetobacter sp.]
MSETLLPIRRALISVSDKTGLLELARNLSAHGVEILSTGGSAKTLLDVGISVTEVSDYTGFPEILDGRVKTLVPQIHGGILGRRDVPEHCAQMKEHNIKPIDLVVVNLYPFEETVASGAEAETCIENIDIGGPALIRASAKNYSHVVILTDPIQYNSLTEALDQGGTTLEMRKHWAGIAYAHTAAYDSNIATWFAQQRSDQLTKQTFGENFVLVGKKYHDLRYGENSHQQAAFYRDSTQRLGVATATQIQGKILSYNNINDTDAAFELVAEFDKPAVVIVKHANPCGVAIGKTLAQAWDEALKCDPVSAFGGIVAFNRKLDVKTAEKISTLFLEVVVAPDVDEEARSLLAHKKNLRVLVTGGLPDVSVGGTVVRSVAGGFLVQTRDNGSIMREELRVVTQRAPSSHEIEDLLFAFRVAKHVKSNAVVYAKNQATVGIGAGQMSRVDSARIAAIKSGQAARAAGQETPLTQGSVVASDAFFPFADGLETVIAAGATAVIQPGGSIRDDEVIAAADAAGVAMVFTGMRHFRH